MQTKGEVLIRWENGQEERVGSIDLNALGPKVLIGMEEDEMLRGQLVAAETVRTATDWLGKAVNAE